MQFVGLPPPPLHLVTEMVAICNQEDPTGHPILTLYHSVKLQECCQVFTSTYELSIHLPPSFLLHDTFASGKCRLPMMGSSHHGLLPMMGSRAEQPGFKFQSRCVPTVGT